MFIAESSNTGNLPGNMIVYMTVYLCMFVSHRIQGSCIDTLEEFHKDVLPLLPYLL